MDPLLNAVQLAARRALTPLLETAHRHPRRIAAATLALLGGFAATAFGVAPLAADDTPVAVRQISEPLELPGLAQQTDTLAAEPLQLARTEVTRASDTADTLLRRLGVQDLGAARFLRQSRDARTLFDGQAGKLVEARVGRRGELLQLIARMPAGPTGPSETHFLRLTVSRTADSWDARLERAVLERVPRLGSGLVRGSIWAAMDDARLPEAIAAQLIEIFEGSIDFHRQLTRGDRFRVVYEGLAADGQSAPWNEGTGRILAAEFVNAGRTHQAFWQASPEGHGGYLGPDGKSVRHAFLASPLPFSRVTSGFAMRVHPVQQNWKAHHGVDYGAPTGTPVLSVGAGTIEFAGRQRGYGNVVEVRHDARRSTLYAHLSAIHVQQGQSIAQGQSIGQVGATGMATGPHLHFEFRIDGTFQDPLQLAGAEQTVTLDAASRSRFQQQARAAGQQLKLAGSLTGFRGDAE